MILFPSWFLTLIVYGGIAIAAIGVLALLSLLLRDFVAKTLW